MHNTLRSHHLNPNDHVTSNTSSPNTTGSHEVSLNDSSTSGTLARRHAGQTSNTHTLTKTNPYRHKVLTNGSFLNLNLKDVVGPLASSGSDDASNSSRPTTSTEDTNSDSGSNENNSKQMLVKRSKSHINHPQPARFAAGHNPPDLLPPPNGFETNVLQNSQYPLDATAAKALIDTYSGNLFSRSTNYYSFRGNTCSKKYPASPVETLFTRDPANFEQDSLNNEHSGSNYYDRQQRCTVVVPPNTGSHNPNNNNNNTAPRLKTRTESVV